MQEKQRHHGMPLYDWLLAEAALLPRLLSEDPNGHQLLPSRSFCGVCAQPVTATHRAKARVVLLNDIGYPQNEVIKNQAGMTRINRRLENIKAFGFRPWNPWRVLQDKWPVPVRAFTRADPHQRRKAVVYLSQNRGDIVLRVSKTDGTARPGSPKARGPRP